MSKSSIHDKARYTAAMVLNRVIEEGAYSNIALNQTIGEQRLNRQDAAFATYLTMGVLERKLYLDWVIGKYLKRWPGHALICQILRLGCYQALFSESVPDSAAVNTSVELAKDVGASGLSALVNGVLRNIIRNKNSVGIPRGDSVEDTALRYSCKPWMAEMLIAQYTGEEIEAILGFHQIPLTVTVNDGKGMTRDQAAARLREDGWDAGDGRWAKEAIEVKGAGSIARHPLFKDGDISIVSESALLAAACVDARPGERVLDACAAPGGKSALLAQCVGEEGIVDAWDIHPHRVDIIAAQAKRLGLTNIRLSVQDATVRLEELYGNYDRVLCDMPCTGWGVLSQKPELRFNSDIRDVGSLNAVQREILERCGEYVRPGGVLVYVTCTVNKSENEDIIISYLDNHEEYRLGDLSPYLPRGLHPYIRDKGMIQLMAGRDGIPGFFIGRMVREK